jgi:uncharacterized damage-inducible protein DinB
MAFIDLMIAELEREGARTRRVVANVPTGRDDWKPHPKSMSLRQLASLVATMPSWIPLIVDQDELDLTPPPGATPPPPPAIDQLVATLDMQLGRATESLKKTTESYLMTTTWRLKAGGHVPMQELRHIVLRDTINHWAHHRGQLTVFLRLLDAPVPSVYGPSADDARFL